MGLYSNMKNFASKNCIIHLVNICGVYYELSTVVDTRDIVVSKVDKGLNLREFIFWQRITDNKQANKL